MSPLIKAGFRSRIGPSLMSIASNNCYHVYETWYNTVREGNMTNDKVSL